MVESLGTTAMAPPVAAPKNAERPLYPIGVPTKFSKDGIVQRYPGNTTLCHLSPDSILQPGLRSTYAALSNHPTLSKLVRLLPPDSWHMTVLDGVREEECEPGMWPPGKEKQTVEESTADMTRKLRHLGLQLKEEGLAPPYRMKVRGFDAAVVGIGLEIEGANPEEEARMRRVRDRLADTFGFRAPNHYTYGFHLSMAYLLRHVDGQDREALNEVIAQQLPQIQLEFELGAVEFCTFENMLSFKRLLYLGDAN